MWHVKVQVIEVKGTSQRTATFIVGRGLLRTALRQVVDKLGTLLDDPFQPTTTEQLKHHRVWLEIAQSASPSSSSPEESTPESDSPLTQF